MKRVSTWYCPSVPPPAPLPKRNGSVKSWVAPMVDRTMVKRIVGRSPGMVTLTNCRNLPAPSMAAAS